MVVKMRVYLRDYTWSQEARSAWARSLAACFGLEAGTYTVKDPWEYNSVCQAKAEDEHFKSQSVVIFVHGKDRSEHKTWVRAATSWAAGHIVLVSRPGQLTAETVQQAKCDLSAEEQEACKDRIHACWWGVEDFSADRSMRPEIVSLVEGIRANSERWWMWLQPTDTSFLVALSILCQGYLAVRERIDLLMPEVKQPEKMRRAPPGAKQIVTDVAGWWLKPFEGMRLKEQLEEECHGSIPNEIGELLAVLKGPVLKPEDDHIVNDALRKIQALLNR